MPSPRSTTTGANGGVNTDGDSVSLYGKGTFETGNTTLSLEAGRMGDDNNQGGNSMTLAQNAATGPVVNVSEITTGGMYTTNSAGVANIGGATTLYLTNWLYAKVGVVQKLSDEMKVSAYLAHIEQAEDTPTADKHHPRPGSRRLFRLHHRSGSWLQCHGCLSPCR